MGVRVATRTATQPFKIIPFVSTKSPSGCYIHLDHDSTPSISLPRYPVTGYLLTLGNRFNVSGNRYGL